MVRLLVGRRATGAPNASPRPASEGICMNVVFRLPTTLLVDAFEDLRRPHPFATERVGFLAAKPARSRDGLVLAAHMYLRVRDEWYLEDDGNSCVFGSDALRHALEYAYNNKASIFHVHIHDHDGIPWFSRLDLRETSRFVPDFWHVRSDFPHGAIVLSNDAAAGLCWYPGRQKPIRMSRITALGYPIKELAGFE